MYGVDGYWHIIAYDNSHNELVVVRHKRTLIREHRFQGLSKLKTVTSHFKVCSSDSEHLVDKP